MPQGIGYANVPTGMTTELMQMMQGQGAPEGPLKPATTKDHLKSFTSDLMFSLAQSFAAGPQRGAGLAAALTGPMARRSLVQQQEDERKKMEMDLALKDSQIQKAKMEAQEARRKAIEAGNPVAYRPFTAEDGAEYQIAYNKYDPEQKPLGRILTKEAPKKDAERATLIDEYLNDQGQKVNVFQRPDSSTYEETRGAVGAAPRAPVPGTDVPLSGDVEAQRTRMTAAGRAPAGPTTFEQQLQLFRENPEEFQKFMGRDPEAAADMLSDADLGTVSPEDTLWNRLGWFTTGPLSIIPRTAGRLTGTGQESLGNIQAFQSAKNTMIRALAENPRFAVAEAERLSKEVDIQPNSWDSATTIQTRMREIDKHLDSVIKRREQAGDVAAVNAIQQFRAQMGVPSEAAATGPRTGATREYQGATYIFDGKEWVRQ